MNFDAFLRQVEAGRRGENKWIPIAHRSMRPYIGIGRKMYKLVGGEPGTGKSSYVDTTYVLGPYGWWRRNRDKTDINLKIVVRSMERSKEYRVAKWVSMKLFLDHGILMDVPTIFSWHEGKTKVSDEIYRKIVETKEYFEEMEEVVSVIDGLDNPTGIRNHIKDWCEAHGTTYRMDKKGIYYRSVPVKTDDYSSKYKWVKAGSVPKEVEKAIVEPYEPYHVSDIDNLLFIVVLDHIGKLRRERGFDERENLGKMSQYFGTLRDTYGITPVAVCQFNRNIGGDTQRRQNLVLQPEPQDFKGASNMFEDCDVAKGLFNPHRYRVKDHLGYSIKSFVNREGDINRFRSVRLIKNSYGSGDISFGFNFIGECGYFRVLPSPRDIEPKDYHRAANLTDLLKQRIVMGT